MVLQVLNEPHISSCPFYILLKQLFFAQNMQPRADFSCCPWHQSHQTHPSIFQSSRACSIDVRKSTRYCSTAPFFLSQYQAQSFTNQKKKP